ncbi:hypothetical protein KAH55_04995, partial [bacterium]|nr:hypothetical protein [bacterium]
MASTDIKLIASANVATIHASVDKATLENDPAQTATITAQVLDGDGNPVVDGQPVTFTIISGPGQVDALSTTTGGIATAEFTATPETGTSRIKVSSGVQESFIEIEISGSPYSLDLSASVQTLNFGENTTLIAKLEDSADNPIVGETVIFSFDTNSSGAQLPAPPTAETDINGYATIEYTAGSSIGTDTVLARSSTYPDISDAVSIIVGNAILVGSVTLESNLTELPADGVSSAVITAAAYDTDDSEMPAGTPIILTTTLGTFPGGVDPDGAGPLSSRLVLTTTSTSGQVLTSLIAPLTLTGKAVITATSGGVSQLLNISIGGGGGTGNVVNAIGLVAAQTALSPGDNTSITVMVYDASGHGIGGEDIEFILDDPTLGIITASGVSAADGTFVADFEARNNTGSVTVTAISGSVSSAPLEITIKDQFVDAITLVANPTAITVTNTSTISATVYEFGTVPVASATVTFALQDSAFGTITASAVTNAVGVATATFTAANFPGTATILATSGSVTATPVDLDIQPAEAASIEFGSVSKNPIALRGTGGQEFAVIQFNVKDINGNEAEDVDVLVTMVSGIQGAEYLEDDPFDTPYEQVVGTSGGIAEVTLHSGYEAGTVSITASITAGGATISATTPVISIGGGVVTDEWFVVSCKEPGWNLGGLACVGV